MPFAQKTASDPLPNCTNRPSLHYKDFYSFQKSQNLNPFSDSRVKMIETNDEIERQKMELDDGESSDSAIEEEDNVIDIARALASNTLKERNIVMGFAKI